MDDITEQIDCVYRKAIFTSLFKYDGLIKPSIKKTTTFSIVSRLSNVRRKRSNGDYISYD